VNFELVFGMDASGLKAYAMEAARKLKHTMEEAGSRYMKDVPVTAEASIADNWAEKL